VLLSCKISNSILNFLENQGEDLSDLLDVTILPEEFLRDTSYWMQAAEMEEFLRQALQLSQRTQEYNLFQRAGHEGPSLRAWGVLDSVLRMMPRPQEILAQPERFLSYFVSPSPPIEDLRRTENSVEFDLAVSADQYPLATSFLVASFESLPVYGGQPLASCRWEGIHIHIQWSAEHETLFGNQSQDRQISPELMRSILSTLEKHAHELEEKNRELQSKNEALLLAQANFQAAQLVPKISKLPVRIDSLEKESPSLSRSRAPVDQQQTQTLKNNISRLSDYMVRAQQLITMLVAQGRMNSQVKEAMRRVDWDRVRQQFPKTIEECQLTLESNIEFSESQGEAHV
jgi:hypothetical protein